MTTPWQKTSRGSTARVKVQVAAGDFASCFLLVKKPSLAVADLVHALWGSTPPPKCQPAKLAPLADTRTKKARPLVIAPLRDTLPSQIFSQAFTKARNRATGATSRTGPATQSARPASRGNSRASPASRSATAQTPATSPTRQKPTKWPVTPARTLPWSASRRALPVRVANSGRSLTPTCASPVEGGTSTASLGSPGRFAVPASGGCSRQ